MKGNIKSLNFRAEMGMRIAFWPCFLIVLVYAQVQIILTTVIEQRFISEQGDCYSATVTTFIIHLELKSESLATLTLYSLTKIPRLRWDWGGHCHSGSGP